MKINDLLNACLIGMGKAEVKNTLQFLDNYIVFHFTEEESMMAKHNYPQAPHHISEHQIFSANFYELKKLFQKDGPGPHIVIATNRIVVDWFINHIKKADKALGLYIKEIKTK